MEEIWKDSNIFYKLVCYLITENRKLFGKHDASLYWRTVTHLFGIALHCCVGVYAATYIELVPSDHVLLDNIYRFQFGYSSGYNFAFQSIFLCLSLVYDVLQWQGKHQSARGETLTYYRDLLFCGLVVPFSLFITIMFWSVYLIDRELVFPRVYDPLIPPWFNHCVHTYISVAVLVETLLQPRRLPRVRKIELSLVGGFGVLYAIVYYSIYFSTGRWLYAVFAVMTWWQVCLFQLAIWGSTFLFYYLQFPVNRIIHGPEALKSEAKRL